MRFWLPDYEKRLIGELQKQQNCAQFCDTLLQTEGISIPTHSSVLAALSLHLSQRLSASPAPPAGQKHRVQLNALKPQTLINLIGLLYSGELEVSSALEQRDVLAAAHMFGLPDLREGEKVEVKKTQTSCKNCKRLEIQKRDAQIQVTPKSFCSTTGTQTFTKEPNPKKHYFLRQTTASPFPQNDMDTTDISTSSTCTSSSKTYSAGESMLERSTSATISLSCPSEDMTLHLSPSEDSICSRFQDGEMQPDKPGGSPEEEEEDVGRKVSENKEKTYRESSEGLAAVEKSQMCKHVATQNLEKMQEMIEATQISIKVKLRRRRSKEEMWEVVNMQDPAGLVTSLRPDNCKYPQGDFSAVQSSPSSDQASLLEPITSSPKPGLHNSLALCESASNSSGNPVLLPPPRPAEETDEQIEKLLEDIMIGLNILPKIDKGSDKPKDMTMSQDDYPDQNGNCSTDTEDPSVLELLPLSTETEDNLFSMADLQFLPCLSPLDSNNNSTSGNKTPTHSKPTSLQFPLAAAPQKRTNSPTQPGTSKGCMKKIGNASFVLPANSDKGLGKDCRNLDNDETPTAKRRCPNLRLNKTGQDLNVKTDENVNLSHCLVRLSSNNVLAKDRSCPATSPASARQTPMRKRLRPTTQTSGDSCRKIPIRTRRRSQRSQSTPETPSPSAEVKNDKSKQNIQNTSLEKCDEAASEPKKPRLEEDVKEGPSKQVLENSVESKPEDNSPASAEKKPRMVSLKDFQELIKRQHLKTQRVKDKSEKERSENTEREDATVSYSIQEIDSANVQSENVDMTEEEHEGLSQSSSGLSQLESAKATPSREDNNVSNNGINHLNSSSEKSNQSEICIGVIPESVSKLSGETEEEQRTSPELFHDGVTDSTSEMDHTVDDESVPLAASSANHSPDIQEKTGARGLLDDEEDVDILLHTPDRTSVTTEGQKSAEISPDEEEEEDSNEVDVTGSETDA
ncbi:hypothetical protein WMY93_006099 [Mugilogobius chulae]|uniref:BTB domain-containing protein n=1 Tax=Mugilogobius chulae TaxID=88201 RepID=A0AAW0PSU2_9GOBI